MLTCPSAPNPTSNASNSIFPATWTHTERSKCCYLGGIIYSSLTLASHLLSASCFKIRPESDYFSHHFQCYSLIQALTLFLCIITISHNWSSCSYPYTKDRTESDAFAMVFTSCHTTALDRSDGISRLNFDMTPSYYRRPSGMAWAQLPLGKASEK